MSERCDRCQSVGEDRRTLWHACFYDMAELGLPFGLLAIHGAVCEQAGEKELPVLNRKVPVWAPPSGEPRHHQFYTLRVCKRCRSEWLAAVRGWFYSNPRGQDGDADEPAPYVGPGTGIFVRDLGVNREVTREEWEEIVAKRQKSET